MNSSPHFPWLRRIALVVIGMALLAVAWNHSPPVPGFRDTKSPWIPLAFSPDGKVLAAANSTRADHWWEGPSGGPSGPIHLLRAADLGPASPPVETPTITTDRGSFYPAVQSVEFSPTGDLLAVLQKHHAVGVANLFELILIRLPVGEIQKSFSIPYDGDYARDRVANRFFSADGRLVAWHEFARSDERHVVRVWDVAEGRERFAAEGVAYPTLSPDGRWLAAVEQNPPGGQNDITLRLYDVGNGQVVHSLSLSGDIAGWQPWPEFSQDGRLLVVNSGSSAGKGESVAVFEVSSGKDVFRAGEWSPHFLVGPTLVTVKGNTVMFRETETWQTRGQATFSLGRHWEIGGELRPEPQPVPGRAAVIVYDFYPTRKDHLGTLNRFLHLESENVYRATWIDATSGSETPFIACDGLLRRTAISPGGDRLAVQGSGVTIWGLPPRRSWIPTVLVAGLLAFTWGGSTAVRRRLRVRARPVQAET